MNKLLYIFTLVLCFAGTAKATNYTGTIQAGELKTSLENPHAITELTLSGTMDIRDFAFIADSLRQLTQLDLSDCTITAWESRESYLGTASRFEGNVIPAYAFLGFDNLTSVKLPGHTVQIGDGAFAGCTQLTTIEWGEHLQKVGAYAFAGDSLLNTAFPATLTSIGEYAFENCTAYTEIDLSGTQIRAIGNNAFANCTSASTITLPGTLKTLGNNTFAGCTALTAITIPASVNSMGSSCFAHCSNLTTVDMKDCEHLTAIAPYTFDHCIHLETLEAPISIIEVGEGAFYYCQALTICTLPETTRRINDYAFAKTAIAELNFLPNGIEEIGRWPFYGLDNLQTAILPSTITLIDDHAFDHCSMMSTLYSEAVTPPTLGENVFQDVPQGTCKLFIPEESFELYSSAEQWNQFLIDKPNSKEEMERDETIKAFFVGNELIIQSTEPLLHTSLYTADGRLVHSQHSSTTRLAIDTQGYSNNIFILSVQKESGEYTHLKVGRTH